MAAGTYNQFQNGAITNHIQWLDTSGNLINAHDGGIIYAKGKYHWYGMALRPMSTKEGGQKTTTGVVMYSSTNLYDWDYEGLILECSTNPASPLYGPMRFERPKIIYNDRTKTYVMWFHYVAYPGNHGKIPGSGEAGVASCSSINGKYTFHRIFRPVDDRGMVRDSTVFQDDDGSAYFIYDRDVDAPGPDFGRVLHIVKLSDDYLTPTTNFYEITNAVRREAPVMIKRHGYYFLITSAETGWKFNRANYYRATNIFGPYTEMGDPCVGDTTATTFNTQGTCAFPVQGKPDEILFLCERHNQARMTDSSFIFLPLIFPTASTLQLRYLPSWQWESW
jgi:beta-galactosidase